MPGADARRGADDRFEIGLQRPAGGAFGFPEGSLHEALAGHRGDLQASRSDEVRDLSGAGLGHQRILEKAFLVEGPFEAREAEPAARSELGLPAVAGEGLDFAVHDRGKTALHEPNAVFEAAHVSPFAVQPPSMTRLWPVM